MLAITINGTDRTKLVDPKSLLIVNVLTHQPDTCNFTIKKYGSLSYAPVVDEEVIITDDTNGTSVANNTHCAAFDGSSQYLSIAHSAYINIDDGWTVEFWRKIEVSEKPSAGTLTNIFYKFDSGASTGVGAFIDETGKLFMYANSTSSLPSTDFDICDGVWRHFSLNFNGANSKIHVNAVLNNGTQVCDTITTNTEPLYFTKGDAVWLGAIDGKGKLDDIRIYNSNRTSADILADYQNELDGTEANLQVNWKLNNSLADATSHGQTLTNNGATFSTDVPYYDYTLSATKIFAGHILEVQANYDTVDYVEYSINCVDYTRSLDGKMVVATYENMTVNAIIDSIRQNYLPGAITTNNVNVDTVIDKIVFNYDYPSQCLEKLAEYSSSDWYIDYDHDIHFFQQNANTAPFSLSDTNGNYVYGSLQIYRKISQLRNIIYVRGGEYLADTTTAAYIADGTQRHFFLPYKFSDLRMTVTGQEKSVGVDPIDDQSLYDALHNFQEKVVIFRDSRKPTINSDVRISGRPYLPVITKVSDNESVATFTAREYLVIDKTIQSKEAARQRAAVELYTYKTTISEADFSTYVAGLRSGQTITVQSTNRGLDEQFIINKMAIRVVGNDASDGSVKLQYFISLITTRTFDYIQLLRELINRRNNDLVISDDEVLDQVEAIYDDIAIADTVTANDNRHQLSQNMNLQDTVTGQINGTRTYVYGLWAAADGDNKRQFVLDGSPLA